MASLKAERPTGTQPLAPVKKEPSKANDAAAKAPASKPAPKKVETKPKPEPKKQGNCCKPAVKT